MRGRPWPVRALIAVLVIGAVGAFAWGSSQREEADDARAAAESQREAVLTAQGFVEALMSYDHADLDAQQEAVDRFATDKFRDEYSDAFGGEVRARIESEEASSTVTVRDVYATLGGDDDLTAIVHATSAVSSSKGAEAELESYLRIRLIRLDGRWLVDELESLGSRDLSPPIPAPVAEEGEGP